MSNELREGFEAWADAELWLFEGVGPYRKPAANTAWQAWQAAVAHIRQHDDWQPIETAPKDFVTTVDLWNGERHADCIWGRPTYGHDYYWIRQTGYDSDGPVWDAVRPTPTHWRPLPAPPKEQNNG